MPRAYSSGTQGGSLSVDTENRSYGIITQDGRDYHVFTVADKGEESTVVWEYGGLRYALTSELSVKILLKIADSVKIKNFS